MKARRIIAAFLLLAMVLALLPAIARGAENEGPESLVAPPEEANCTQEEWEVLKLTNQVRWDDSQLGPLTTFSLLQDASHIRAAELLESFSHTRPDGRGCSSVYDEVGLEGMSGLENIAAGYGTPAAAVRAWRESSGHYGTIMGNWSSYGAEEKHGQGYYLHMGVGNLGRYWVQNTYGKNPYSGSIDEDYLDYCFENYDWLCKYTDLNLIAPTEPVSADLDLSEMGIVGVLTCRVDGDTYFPVLAEYCSGYDPNIVGNQTITVEVHGFSAQCRITTYDPETGEVPAPQGTVYMYRLYNPNSGEHFYTGSYQERKDLTEVGWNYEGIAWLAPTNGGVPIYRVFNPNSGDHHYTGSQEEVEMLTDAGWQYEGVAWNSPVEGVQVYRLYNPNADCGSHHYTTSAEERDNLVELGWQYEGVAWNGALTGSHEHSYTSKVTKAATCTEDGVKTFTCSCGASYTETIDATGHNLSEWTVTKEPTTESEGEEIRGCAECDYYETRAVEKLPDDNETGEDVFCTEHSWGNWTSDSNGSYGSCTNCGQSITVDGSGSNYSDEAARLINEYRVSQGLPALTIVNEKTALIRAQEITFVCNHKRLNGKHMSLYADWYAENIHGGSTNAAGAVDGWISSDGHREQLLTTSHTKICVAYNGVYWVAIFG